MQKSLQTILLTLFIYNIAFSQNKWYDQSSEEKWYDKSSQKVIFNQLSNVKNGDYDVYYASDGEVYKIGDKIKIGAPSGDNDFVYITEGDGILTALSRPNPWISGNEAEIIHIYVVGNKRTGKSVTIRVKGATFMNNMYIRFESALASGEIEGYGMSSDKALAELKKAKDKLDLGLITQEEYDKIKEYLRKYIK